MADEAKEKGAKAYEAFYYIVMTLAVIGFGFFGYMKLTDTELYIFDHIIGCYTICFTAALVFIAVRWLTLFRKNGKKFNYQLWLMTAACAVAAACFINSVCEDFGKSKVREVVKINATTDVFLCEPTEKDGSTRIDIYRIGGRLVRKLGEIDEKLFSVKCIQDGLYTCTVSDDGSMITVNCEYGVFGDGIHMLNPAYDTGNLSYTFKIE